MWISDTQDSELAALMTKVQQGDTAMYEKLLAQVSVVLTKYLEQKLKGSPAAQDVLQETLIALHHARHTYDATRSFGSWVFSICEHRLIDHYRHTARAQRQVSLDPGVLAELAVEHPGVPRMDAREQIAEAILKLPAGQRQAIELLKLEGLSIKEASQRLGTSESALKVAAHRGYLALKKLMGARSDEHQ